MKRHQVTQRDMIIALYTEVLGINNGGGMKKQLTDLDEKVDTFLATRRETCPVRRWPAWRLEKRQILVAALALVPAYVPAAVLLISWLSRR